MSDLSEFFRAALKRKGILVAVIVSVVVVLVWLVAFFLPQGKKISTLDSQVTALQQQVIQGNAKVAALKHTLQHAGQLTKMENELNKYVPATADIYDYINSLSTAVAASQMTLVSVSPTAATAPNGAAFTSIPISITVRGTYDHLLTLITDIYSLPRLTDIQKLAISGGGSSANRSSPLSADLSLLAFTTAKPTIAIR